MLNTAATNTETTSVTNSILNQDAKVGHFHALSTLVVDTVESKLSSPDILSQRATCRHANHSISSRTIVDAKLHHLNLKNYFPNMKPYTIPKFYADILKERPDLKVISYDSYKFTNEGINNCLNEKVQLEINETHRMALPCTGVSQSVPIDQAIQRNEVKHIFLGTLQDGSFCFITPHKSLCDSFIIEKSGQLVWNGSHRHAENEITTLNTVYIGKSYEDLLRIFKQVNDSGDFSSHMCRAGQR